MAPPKTSRDGRIRWCHTPTIPGTTPHCLVNTIGDVNSLGTRSRGLHGDGRELPVYTGKTLVAFGAMNTSRDGRPALVAMWSKELPLTANRLSRLPMIKSRTGNEKVASELGLGGGFRRVLWFPLPRSTG